MEPNYILAQAIAENAEDEQEAIKGYYKLLSYRNLSEEDREHINEIIAYMLTIMAMKYDGFVKSESLPEGMTLKGTVERNEKEIEDKEGRE